MRPFKVGDIVVGQNFIDQTHRNGMEGTIVRGLGVHNAVKHGTGEAVEVPGYCVSWENGETSAVRQNKVRHKNEPSEVTAWATEAVKKLFKPQPERVPA